MANRQEFYDILFDKEEGIGYQTDYGIPDTDGFYKKNRVLVHKGDQDEYNFDYHFYCINPIHPTIDHEPREGEENKARIKIANVTSFRNFAIEFDEDTLDEQKRKLRLAKPPISAIVFSGSKSLHTPIALEEGVTQEEYSAIFEAIKQTLIKYDLKLDKQCSNPNRLTRAPFQIRNNTEVEQKLLGKRGRIPNQVLFDWFEANDINWKDYIFKIKEASIEYTGSGDADDTMRWNAAVSSCKHFNGDYANAEQWQPWLYELGKWCKAYGIDEGVAINWANKDYTHPNYKALDTAIKNGYKYGKLSPRTLNKPRTRENIDNNIFDGILDEVEEVLDYDFRVENYYWIGPKIFLIYPDGKRIEYNAQGFNARFRRIHLSVNDIPDQNIYSGFGYYPDYFGNGNMYNNMYNTFKKPNVEIIEGDWTHTKILLEHVFGEQYELGLEYYWVKRHHPTRALPALGLLGGEDSGKSTIGNHQQMVYGNMNKAYIHKLENDENAFAFECQDIILEESNSKGSNKSVNPMIVVNKIKDMITSTGKKIPSKRLYDNAGESDFFAKIMLFTNDTTPLKMDGEATRFWIRRLGKPEKHEDFEKKLQSEVGAFLYYLDNQFIPSRKVSKERLWFHPSEYWTQEKEFARNASGSRLYNTIKDVLIEWFDANPNESLCYFDAKSLKVWVCEELGYGCSAQDIKECLLSEFKFTQPTERRVRMDSLQVTDLSNPIRKSRKMLYWVINQDIAEQKEVEEMEGLDNAFTI